MGIKTLNNLLAGKLKSIELKCQVDRKEYLSNFGGLRIAVDTDNWIFRQMYGAQKQNSDTNDYLMSDLDRSITVKNWINTIIKTLFDMMSFGVTPVMVFDGVSPEQKKATKEKRIEDRQKREQRLNELRDRIQSKNPNILQDVDYCDMDFEDGMADEALAKSLRETLVMGKDIEQDMMEYVKLKCSITNVDNQEKDFLRNILKGIGIPVIQAKGDAEQLCSRLCIEGKVAAVLSNDSDNHPFGAPVTIVELGPRKFFNKLGRYDRELKVRRLADILRAVDLPYSSFVDLCIGAGCDYNKNMTGIGIGKLYPLVKKYGSLDNFPPEYREKMECLNHIVCREIFFPRPSEETIINGTLDIPERPLTARDTLSTLGLDHMMRELLEILANMPRAADRGFRMDPHNYTDAVTKSGVRINIIKKG
jgi:5'-3' exonuclease